MVARNSPDGLPAGWTVNCKVLNSGRKLKYYTDLKTGKKFYSMNEVYRYMKSMSGKSLKIPQLRPRNGQVQQALNAQNLPRRLPAGWAVNCKMLNSGRKLKYYTDLKTGKKFYSMNEVNCYMKSKNGNSLKTQTSSGKHYKGSVKKYLHGVQKTNSDLGWLPKSWVIELRQYEAGPQIGREYKVYIDKSTGYKCYSRLEVLRRLKKQNKKDHFVREIENTIVTRSKSCVDENSSKAKMDENLNDVDCETHTPDEKKLCRSAQNASSRAPETFAAKAQKLPTEVAHRKNSADKVTCVVRNLAMSDVHLNGVQTRGSKRRQQSDLDDGCSSPSTAILVTGDNIFCEKIETQATSRNKGSLPCRFSKRLARLDPEVATSFSSTNYDLAPPSSVKRSNRVKKMSLLSKMEGMDEREKRYQSLSASEVDPILKEESTVSTGKNSYDSSNYVDSNRDGRLCCRFSKRLAGFEPEVTPIPGFSANVTQGLGKRLCTDQAKSISASALYGVVHKSSQQHPPHIEQPDLSSCLLNKSNSEQSHLGFGGNAGNTNTKTRHKMKSDKTKQLAEVELDVFSDSSVEFKSRLPTTSQDILLETVGATKDRETQQQNPIWHSWSDPCLEFAFKTLTGEISIEDDLQIASYFQQIKNPAQKDASTNNASLDYPECSHTDAPQKSLSTGIPQPDLNSGSAIGYNWINSQQSTGAIKQR